MKTVNLTKAQPVPEDEFFLPHSYIHDLNMIKAQDLSPYLKKIAFPQRDFAQAIIQYIKPKMGRELKCLVDAPCGFGQTTYYFAEAFPQATVFGLDIDPELVQYGKKHLNRENIKYAVQDIQRISELELPKVDVFCIINSVFLLPDMDQLLRDIHKLLSPDGWLIMVIPNIKGSNYKYFISKFSSSLNVREFTAKEAESILDPLGFQLIETEPIIHIRIFGGRIRKAFFFFLPFLIRFIDRITRSGTPAYHILFCKPIQKEPAGLQA